VVPQRGAPNSTKDLCTCVCDALDRWTLLLKEDEDCDLRLQLHAVFWRWRAASRIADDADFERICKAQKWRWDCVWVRVKRVGVQFRDVIITAKPQACAKPSGGTQTAPWRVADPNIGASSRLSSPLNGVGRRIDAWILRWSISLLLGAFIVKVLDRAHQVPLDVERQCRPRTSGVENLDSDPRRQRQILQSNADLGQALATLESFAVFGTRVLNRDSNVNAVIIEQPIDDREVAFLSSQSHGAVVFGRRINALVSQQSFDDGEVAFPSSKSHGVVAVGRRIDAHVLQQSFDDRDVAILSSQSDGVVVVCRRIDALVLQQSLNDRKVAVISGTSHGAVVAG
jgi:hypothetical protein